MKYFNALINSGNVEFKEQNTDKAYTSIQDIFNDIYNIDEYTAIETLDAAKKQNVIAHLQASLTDSFYPEEIDSYDVETAFDKWLKEDSTQGITVFYDNAIIVYLLEDYENEAYDYIESTI